MADRSARIRVAFPPVSVGRLAVAALVVLVVLAVPRTVHADPAGPTDFRSEVASIDPPTPTIRARILGGDAFVELAVTTGTSVLVSGYQAEPYLRFDADGSVFENRRSPAYFLNQERYGTDVPARASATADPDWVRVARDGTWAWHDHRAHRMEEFPPVNVGRGEQILDQVIPLQVDGVEVDLRIRSVWMPAPSLVPGVLGAVGGGVAALGAAWAGRRGPRDRSVPAVAVVGAVVAAFALVVGGTQFAALPASTDPRWLWCVAPAFALVAALVAAVGDRRAEWRTLVVPGAAALAGAQLVVWGWERRTGIVRAILPVEVPFWLDRAVTAGALTVGALATLVAVLSIVRTAVRPAGVAR